MALDDKGYHASQIILRDFYVDDLLSGASSVQEATNLQTQLNVSLHGGGFELRKWALDCNNELIQRLPQDLFETSVDLDFNNHNENARIETLGISWNPYIDAFSVSLDICPMTAFTKKSLLADIGRIFDPMRWFSPVVIVFKCFL